jgi:hypothetical protein
MIDEARAVSTTSPGGGDDDRGRVGTESAKGEVQTKAQAGSCKTVKLAAGLRTTGREGEGTRGRHWASKEEHCCKGKTQRSGSTTTTATGDMEAGAIRVWGE